ncbi:hypothetical protein Q3A66_17055 [Hymenobacter sp. BT770]|uniref:hypothetical protein n=1 Tax=Hymenobacter sp. BT770 TaxID=2886942 RepID=UPI001D10909C|nr:hypothetical protein [Hymenobacter sp. BT770]MCC3154845.1 hypothetical protein [Hymenobacter sp. BT770]MDO3416780.1 hypothetical protein [Hymenobacter sp. BT770]
MLALKRIVTVAVMIYLLLALLFIFVPAVRTSVMGMGSGLSALEQERQFYYTLFVIGAILLALHLVTENLDSAILRRSVSQYEGKINELKAKLYDQQQRATAPVVAQPSRTVDGRIIDGSVVETGPAGTVSTTETRTTETYTPDHLPRPTFPQTDPSLPNTPPAERPLL